MGTCDISSQLAPGQPPARAGGVADLDRCLTIHVVPKVHTGGGTDVTRDPETDWPRRPPALHAADAGSALAVHIRRMTGTQPDRRLRAPATVAEIHGHEETPGTATIWPAPWDTGDEQDRLVPGSGREDRLVQHALARARQLQPPAPVGHCQAMVGELPQAARGPHDTVNRLRRDVR